MIINAISKSYQNISSLDNKCNKSKVNQSFDYNYIGENNLTFEQSQAIKSSLLINNITFKGKIIAPSYDVKDVKLIKNLLSKCQYGKKDLIYGNISNVRLIKTESGCAIENFYTKDENKNDRITGICEELTFKLGKRLENLFNGKYIYFAVNGSNKEFPDGHVHLLAFRNTPENQLKLNQIMQKQSEYFKKIPMISQKISQLNQEFYTSQVFKDYSSKFNEMLISSLVELGQMPSPDKIQKIQAQLKKTSLGAQLMQKEKEFNEKINQLKPNFDANALKGSLMIDPSFNRIEEFGAGDLFDHYIINAISTLEQINAVPSNSRNIIIGQGLPIGYLKDLIPEKANMSNRKAMGVLNNIGNTIRPSFDSDYYIMDSLSPSHLFTKFMNKLNESGTK